MNTEPRKEAFNLSDADNQMGGTGGDTGAPPGAGQRPADEADRKDDAVRREDDPVNRESQDSFPASDPPANY